MQDRITGIAPTAEQPGSTHHAPSATPKTKAEEPAKGSVKVAPVAKPKAPEKAKVQVKEPISLDELAEMLRKVNLTFDLFEIAAQYSVEDNGHRVRIVVHNTRTGEVIRRIPPSEFVANYHDIKAGLGTSINESA